MAAFRGFPAEALEFLAELEANNDRDWFKANRARYDEFLVAPATALGEDLSDLGTPKLFRPWNDTRFHAAPPARPTSGARRSCWPSGCAPRARRPASRTCRSATATPG